MKFEVLNNFNKKKKNLVVQLKTVVGLGLVAICYYASISCLAPFFSKVAQTKGVSISWSGFVFVASPFLIVVISPFLGTVIGRIGAQKCFFGGMILMGISNILFGFLDRFQSPVFFTVGCLLCRAFLGIGAAAMGTNIVFLAAAFPNEINKAVSLNEIFVGIGVSLGPTVGGLLYDLGGFPLPFWVLGTLLLCLLPVCAYCLPEVDNGIEKYDESSGKIYELIMSPVILLNLLAAFVFAAGWTFIDPILEPELRKEFGVSSSVTGSIFLILAVTYTASSIFLGKVADSIKSAWILTFIGCAGSAVAILSLDPSFWFDIPSFLWMKFCALGFLGIFLGMGFAPTYGIMIDDVLARGFVDNSATHGTLSGFWNSLYAFGDVIGPTFGAVVTDHYGFNVVCAIMSMFLFITAALYLLYFNFYKARSDYSLIRHAATKKSKNDQKRTRRRQTSLSELSGLLPPPIHAQGIIIIPE